MEKLKLFGFNNLTKTLSFNIYDVAGTASPDDKQDTSNGYIDGQYSSKRLNRFSKLPGL